METNIIKIYTDGSCLGNPGYGGYGAILVYKEDSKIVCGSENNTTNNRMELKAVIEGLKTLKSNKIPIEIYIDSKYVSLGITEYLDNWKVNGRKLSTKQPVKNKDLWIELDELIGQFKINWHWVKGHSDDLMNNLVDKIARKEAKKLKTLIEGN
ncbi:MAG: ribonuclease HI [Candidatus Absconditabacteria bacterium]